MEQTIWGHLPVLMRANSKESIEYVLQALWRTRKTGLGTSDRCIIQDMLQLHNESDLDPVLALFLLCLWMHSSSNDLGYVWRNFICKRKRIYL